MATLKSTVFGCPACKATATKAIPRREQPLVWFVLLRRLRKCETCGHVFMPRVSTLHFAVVLALMTVVLSLATRDVAIWVFCRDNSGAQHMLHVLVACVVITLTSVSAIECTKHYFASRSEQ